MQMNRSRHATLIGLLIVLVLATPLVIAQSFQGTLVGQVLDASGATVPGANITVTHEGTGRTQTATTISDGTFAVPQLVPGSYTVTAKAQGFAVSTRKGLVLQTGQTARVELRLNVTAKAEVIEVSATAPTVNTDTSSKGEVVTSVQVADLPLNGRNFNDLAILVAGVYPRPSGDDQGEGLATAGARTDSTNYTLDGVANRSDRNGAVGVNTSLDSIREFNVSTSTYSAEFGRTAGAQVSVVSKSGSNSFHGSLFEYHRNSVFDAANFFSGEKQLLRNQYGGTVGGPIKRNKTFFFGSYEGTREHRSAAALNSAPLAAWLQGDFSQMRGPGSDGILGNSNDTNRVLEPFFNTATNRWERREFPNCSTANTSGCNRIPQSRINPISAQILPFYPAANSGGATSTAYQATGMYVTNADQYLVKLDHTFSPSNNAYVRWARQTKKGYDPFPSLRNFYPNMGRDLDNRWDSLGVSDTHLLTPTTINEFRFGVYDQHTQNLGEHRDVDWIERLGISGLNPGESMQGFPAIRVDGFSEQGDRPNDPFAYTLRNYQFTDTLTMVRGRHQFRVGADIIRSQYNEADVRNIRGDFRFRGYFSNPAGKTSSGMYSFADFLLGMPDSTQRQLGADPARLHGWQVAFFAQDDFRVNPWLTLNLGLRYELQTPLNEENNRLGNFMPDTGTVLLAEDGDLLKTRKNNFAPRVGFALRPFGDDKTVIRGGAGIFFSLETFNVTRQQLAVTYPFIERQQFSRQANWGLITFQNPFPEAIAQMQGVNTPFGASYENHTPTITQYNLTLERELIPDLTLEMGYIGSAGRHLGRRYNINMPLPTGQVTQTGATYTPVTARRWTTLGDIQYQEQQASSGYNAFQASLRRRNRNGLTLLASYTWSRSIDDASSTNNSTTGTQKVPQNISDFKAERGLSDFHRKHQFTASVNYELPFGRGKRFLNTSNAFTNGVLGNWQINAIASMLSGRPFTPQYNSADVTSQRPDLVGDPYANIPEGLFFNPAAFARPVASPTEPDLFGNAGRNILIGPTFKNLDISMMKTFPVTEGVKVQFRAEAFNILNHPNFQLPTFLLDNSLVGRVTSTANEGREMQFALRIMF